MSKGKVQRVDGNFLFELGPGGTNRWHAVIEPDASGREGFGDADAVKLAKKIQAYLNCPTPKKGTKANLEARNADLEALLAWAHSRILAEFMNNPAAQGDEELRTWLQKTKDLIHG
jgi:hypothetical protein